MSTYKLPTTHYKLKIPQQGNFGSRTFRVDDGVVRKEQGEVQAEEVRAPAELADAREVYAVVVERADEQVLAELSQKNFTRTPADRALDLQRGRSPLLGLQDGTALASAETVAGVEQELQSPLGLPDPVAV